MKNIILPALNGLVKLLWSIIPYVLFTTLSIVLITIANIPEIFASTYYTIIMTPRLSKKLRFALFCVAYIPIILIAVIACCVSLILSVVLGIVFPFFEAFYYGNTCNLSMFGETLTYIKKFQNLIENTYMEYLAELRTPHPNDYVFDISFVRIICGTICFAIGFILTMFFTILICVLKCIPVWLTIFVYGMGKDWIYKYNYSLKFLVIYIIMLPLSLIIMSVAILVSITSEMLNTRTIFSTIVATKSVSNGYRQAFNNIYDFDIYTSEYLSNNPRSIFSCCKSTITFSNDDVDELEEVLIVKQPEINNNSEILLSEIWENFFNSCRLVVAELDTLQRCHSEIQEKHEHLFRDVPALIIYRVISKSLYINGFALCDDKIVTLNNIPKDDFSIDIYKRMTNIKNKLRKMNLSIAELEELEHKIYESSYQNYNPNSLISELRYIGADISFVSSFHKKFSNILDEIINSDKKSAKLIF